MKDMTRNRKPRLTNEKKTQNTKGPGEQRNKSQQISQVF